MDYAWIAGGAAAGFVLDILRESEGGLWAHLAHLAHTITTIEPPLERSLRQAR